MLWYKSWLETRWRFVIGLALLMLSACGTVLDLSASRQAAAAGASIDLGGEIGRRDQRRRMSWRAITAATSGRSGFART